MDFVSPTFALFALAAVALLRLAPLGRVRDLVLLGLNGAFLASFAREPLQLAALLGFVGLSYGAILLCGRTKSTALLWAAILLLVGLFAWLKQYPFARIAPLPVGLFVVVGLSYILFRVLHLLIDVFQDALEAPGPLDYLNYLFFFPAFVSGPIQRYEDFASQKAQRAPADWASVHAALHRIVAGLVMVALVSTLAADLVASAKESFATALSGKTAGRILALYLTASLAYLVELYANFAGYMHIVIGLAALAGYRLPENFNQPFQSKNFMDFWARWHMTLSAWFRTYLFNPLLKALTRKWPDRKAAPYLAAAAFFVTFFVMGVWHGASLAFVVYGLFLGAGITVNRLWQVWAVQWWGKDGYKRLCERTWYRQASRAAALSYFTVALTCLWVDGPLFAALMTPKGAAIASAAFTILVLIGGVVGLAWDRASAFLAAPKDENATAWRLGVATLGPVAAIFGLAALANLAWLAPDISGGVVLATKTILVTALVTALAAVTAGAADPGLDRLFARVGLAEGGAAAWMGTRIFLLINLLLLFAGAAAPFVYQEF